MKNNDMNMTGANEFAGGALAVSDEHLALDNQLCFALYSASRKVIRAYRPFLEGLGVTYPQYLVLLVLWEWGGQENAGATPRREARTVSALGDRLHLDSGTLTPLLKRLELAGLLTRSRSSKDERLVELALTAEGRALKEKAREIPIKMFCQLDQPAEKLIQLRNLLREFGDSIPA